jgi:hypothetical protein
MVSLKFSLTLFFDDTDVTYKKICQIEFIENVSMKSCLIEVQTTQWSHALSSVNN